MSDRDAFRAAQQERREHGLKARHETREARAHEQLVNVAYEEVKDELLIKLDGRVSERKRWIAEATDETRAFWLKMRARGLPDRTAELDACQRLADEIREIGSRDPE